MRFDCLIVYEDGLGGIAKKDRPFLQHPTSSCIVGENAWSSLRQHNLWNPESVDMCESADQKIGAAGPDNRRPVTEGRHHGGIIHEKDHCISVIRQSSRRLIVRF
jgi:hypothetical protein